ISAQRVLEAAIPCLGVSSGVMDMAEVTGTGDTRPKLLIVDDDHELCSMLVEYLGPEGFATETVGTGPMALDRLVRGPVDLMVLDVMLPELSGFEVLRRIRALNRVPVIMLTARGEEVDRVVGLEMGADDYLEIGRASCRERV